MAADTITRLGKYEIRGTLGKGAMGIVYDGFDPVIQRRVAIKTIAKQSLDPSESADLLDRFKREAQAAGRLNHPGIVSIHDYGEDDGLAFIAMEFIRGIELRKYFESQQRFPLAHVVRIMCDMLDALDHAHRNGVVHRDVKPANIMITDEGRVKVADFGVARIESSMLTQVGVRFGTPAYMSPEQHRGLPVSARSDVFSAGVILYEFLTGVRPFNGDGYMIVQQIFLHDAAPPSAINPDIPPSIDAVTMKALAKRPEDRFATAREFAEALRAAARRESGAAGIDVLHDDRTLRLNDWSAMPVPAPGRAANMAESAAISGGASLSELSLQAELEYWREIKDSTEAADFETFLRAFPESRFAPLARRRKGRLQDDAKAKRDAEREGEPTLYQRSGAEPEAAIDAAQEAASHTARAHDEPEALLTEADSRRAAEAPAHDEISEPPVQEAKARKAKSMGRQRNVDWRLPRLDAEEPTLRLRAVDAANEPTPMLDRSPRVTDSPASAAGLAHAAGAAASGDAPLRGAELALEQPMLPRASFAGSGRARKPSRRPIAATFAALVAAGGIWYATQPEFAPIAAALRTRTLAIIAPLEHKWQALEGQQAEQERKKGETARVVEERRENDEALNAERDRQLALARQKEEAARAATQNYQRALALLDQGRSSEGVRLLRQLAYEGHGAAAKTLGDLYASGEKVLLDRQEAALFYTMAERNGVRIERSNAVGR